MILRNKFSLTHNTILSLFRYGPGPHRVRVSVVLPSDKTETEQSFIIEMASLDLMPHAIHMFLEQVSHGLWNNGWFYINGPHVIQCGPQATEDDTKAFNKDAREVALQPFREKQLESLAFPEYSEKFPHVPWTIGYTGRPGGPDWYINKVRIGTRWPVVDFCSTRISLTQPTD